MKLQYLLMVGEMDTAYPHSVHSTRDGAAEVGLSLEIESGHDFEVIPLSLDPAYADKSLWKVRLNGVGNCIHCSQHKLDAGPWDVMTSDSEGSVGFVLANDVMEATQKAYALVKETWTGKITIPPTSFFYKRFMDANADIKMGAHVYSQRDIYVPPKPMGPAADVKVLPEPQYWPKDLFEAFKRMETDISVVGNESGTERYIIRSYIGAHGVFVGEDIQGRDVGVGENYLRDMLKPMQPEEYIAEGQVWVSTSEGAVWDLVIISVEDGNVQYTGMGGHVYGCTVKCFVKSQRILHFVEENPCLVTRGVLKMVTETIGKPGINLMHKLVDDLGMDSLDFTEMVVLLEEDFEIDISDAAADTFRTVHDIIKYIKGQRK